MIYTVTKIKLQRVPAVNQSVTLILRKSSDADIPANRITLGTVLVQPDGFLVTPFAIEDLLYGTEYTLKAIHSCSGTSAIIDFIVFKYVRTEPFTKECPSHFTGTTVNYSKSYISNISQEDAEAQAEADLLFDTEGQAFANSTGVCIEDEHWFNEEQIDYFTRNNCPVHFHGTSVPFAVDAGVYKSYVSLADANAMALAYIAANGQANANTLGSCIEDDHWWNEEQYGDFVKDDCGPGFYGNTVRLTVPANTYKSYISLADANATAVAYIAANGQANANTLGICVPDGEFVNVYQSDDFTKDDCSPGYHGSVVTLSVAPGTYSSLISQEDADDQALAYIAANGQANANTLGECIPDTYAFKWVIDPSSWYCVNDTDTE